jgi:hypothetical protein
VNPVTPEADFGRLMQYGAVGVVAAGLLALVVVLFRQFVNHALEQNKTLLERHDEMQKAHVEAMRELTQAIHGLKTELRVEFGQLFNELTAITEGTRGGSRGYRIKPPRGG